MGPFWCVINGEGCWLRFSVSEDNTVKAQIAKPIAGTSRTEDWEDTADRLWTVFYEAGNHTPFELPHTYGLENGVLYHTDHKKEPLFVGKYTRDGWIKANGKNIITENDTASAINRPPSYNLPPYTALPLTADMVTELWEDLKKNDLLNMVVLSQKNTAFHSLLGKDYFCVIQRKFLDTLLAPDCMLNESEAKYQSPQNYVDALVETINNPDSQGRQQVNDIAAETHFERIRRKQGIKYNEKSQYILNLLIWTVEYLCATFSLPAAVIIQPEITEPLNKNNASTSRNSSGSTSYTNSPSDETDDPAMQRGLVNSLKVVPFGQVEQIKQAVSDAQELYQKWFNTHQVIRGREGFFTRIRHGKAGQQSAIHFNEIIQGTEYSSTEALFKVIQEYLGDDKRAYHRHSFASFLLDELSQINGTPWTGLRLPLDNPTGHYDKKMVSALEWLDSDLHRGASSSSVSNRL